MAERDFAWTRICATAVEVARPHHCRCSGTDNNPRRYLLPTSKAVRYNKRLLLPKGEAVRHN